MGAGWVPPDGSAPEGGSSGDRDGPPPFTSAPPGSSGLPPHLKGAPTTESSPPFHDPPYSGPSHPVPTWVPPVRATLSPHRGRRERWVWVAVVAVLVGLCALWIASTVRGLTDAAGGPAEPGPVAGPEVPSSLPGAPDVTSTLPSADPEDAAVYDEVRCRFEGSSTVEPGVRISDGEPTPQRMELLPGATFDCTSVEGRTTGGISMTTEMPEMTARRGKGSAIGVIDWTTVGPGIAPDLGRRSNLTAEVELAFPNVILLFTIQDGPYQGYKGRVVLGKWTFRNDEAGRIVQVDFEPTDVVLSDG
ncbi:hypothetical protein [Dermatobacter hominis]|uniref:hypothetical protein n=1 Tax=Dermatobacter hominis TaxID=2884263 RepID=UPI001D0F7F0E|nr:hypothetical protein [Dermatobacter hominis]UDY34813.1 hypothetical protein LH044_15905 [Dermatobacter hominis]